MTWVIGAPTMFGYSIALADIQVTLTYPDKSKKYLDAIQKLFPIGKFVVAGFSGDVEIGYLLMEDLRRWFFLPEKERAWIPDCLVMDWKRRARFIYSKIPPKRQCAVELLFVAVYPQKNNGIPGEAQTFACKMKSPLFEPAKIDPGKVISIGSGNNVAEYRRTIDQLATGYNSLMQMEVNNPGGYGLAITINTSINVKNNPEKGLSSHFHTAEVRRGKISFGTNDHSGFDAEGSEVKFKMPEVATNWTEFKEKMKQQGIALADVQAIA